MSNSLAFDISAWQRRPSLKWFKDMKAAGYGLCWVQLWGLTPNGNGPNPDAEYQLMTARAAGLATAGYIVIYGDDTDGTSVLIRTALTAAGAAKKHLTFVALDVETAPIRMSRLVNAYTNLGKQLPGVRRAMYTSRWKWSIAFGDQPWPFAADTPLLEARYWFNSGFAPTTPPDLDWMWIPFGGWIERAMLQFAGTVDTLGVGVDRCVYDPERMDGQGEAIEPPPEHEIRPPKPPPPPPPPAPKPPAGTEFYTVKASDSDGLSGIAMRKLADANRWREIAKLNPSIKPPRYIIQKGNVILIPTRRKAPPAPAPAPAPKPRPGTRPYTVRASDGAQGISGIALRELGDANRWREIAALNNLKSPYTIHKDQVLLLPTSGTPAPRPKPSPLKAQYVVVRSGNRASSWFVSEAALLRLNPNFRTIAYTEGGRVMRRFSARTWHDIYPPERLRIA